MKNYFSVIMMDNDIRGWMELNFSRHLSTIEEKLGKKPQPGKVTRPGTEPGPARWEATMLPLDHGGRQNVLEISPGKT